LVTKRFHSIKPEIRILGIDDSRFVPRTKGVTDVVGVVYKGGYWFEGVMHTTVTIDGLDATEKIAMMIKSSSFYGEFPIVILNGITFAGFNVVDISKLSQAVNLPVISVTRERPNMEQIKSALKHLSNFEIRWHILENAGNLFEVETRKGENPIYIQIAGILLKDAKLVVKNTSTQSNIPEALRVAHIIASGLAGQDGKHLKD
jgi:endonuclease V-like protein UPF0215 family